MKRYAFDISYIVKSDKNKFENSPWKVLFDEDEQILNDIDEATDGLAKWYAHDQGSEGYDNNGYFANSIDSIGEVYERIKNHDKLMIYSAGYDYEGECYQIYNICKTNINSNLCLTTDERELFELLKTQKIKN